MKAIILGAFGSGMCVMGLFITCWFALKVVIDEFRKPVDEQARKERIAYLEAKRNKWEAYFSERSMFVTKTK